MAAAPDPTEKTLKKQGLTDVLINGLSLEYICAETNIDTNWINDGQFHQLSCILNEGVCITDKFTIELQHDEKKDCMTLGGMFVDPETTGPNIPQDFWCYARWEFVDMNKIIMHKYDCGKTCGCVDINVLACTTQDTDPALTGQISQTESRTCYNTRYNTRTCYRTRHNTKTCYRTRHNTKTCYRTRHNTKTCYRTRHNTKTCYRTRHNTKTCYRTRHNSRTYSK